MTVSNPSTQSVQVAGVTQTGRPNLNLLGQGDIEVNAIDNPGLNRTDVLVSGAGTPALNFGRITYDNAATAADAQQRGYTHMVLQYDGGAGAAAALIAALRPLLPGVKFLIYKVAVELASQVTSGITTFTGVNQNTPHPDWFLRDSLGNKYTQNFAGGNPQMDIGNAGYMAAAVGFAITHALAEGADGIFIDNVLCAPLADGYYIDLLPATGTIASDANYQAAWNTFLAYAKQQLAANGLTMLGGNTSGSIDHPDIFQQYMGTGKLDLAEDETFALTYSTTAATNYASQTRMNNSLACVQYAEARGKSMLVKAYVQGNEQANTYAFCAALLCAGGRTAYIVDNSYTGALNNPYVGHPAAGWDPIYDKHRALGKPLAPYFSSGGVYRRDFAHGFVLLNPTGGALTETISGISVPAHTGQIIERGRSYTRVTANGNVQLQPGLYRILARGGGGGGGGGGAASTASVQAGGAGGSAAMFTERLVQITQPTTVAIVIGGGGTAGAGGAAGSNPGTAGGAGQDTTVTNTNGDTVNITAKGQRGGAGSLASSGANAGPVPWGNNNSSTSASLTLGVASGGVSGLAGGNPVGYTSGGGGGGGPSDAAGHGGGGGGAGTLGDTASGTAGASAASGTTAGINGVSAAANSGGGGGGGGGGTSNTGAGGNGGAGGSGQVEIIQEGVYPA